MAVALPLLLAASAAPASAAPDGELRILLFYKSNFHASHVQAREAVRDLAEDLSVEYDQPLEIEETDQASAFTTENLADKDAVVFAQTGGVLFDVAQRTALEAYIRGGGGYMGLHYAGWSVGQSEHDVNPFYRRLVGAMSEGHPENPAVRPGRVVVKDTTHPLTQGLPNEFNRSDEWYDWTVNPAPNVRTLLEADESSYGMGRQGSSHPITWCQEIDAGRSWYTGMGHAGEHYSEPVIRTQMRNGLAYAAGLLAADCSPPSKTEHGSWSGVTPWPLMPINMALTADGKVQSFGSVSTGCTDNAPFDWTGNSCISQGGQMEFDVWDPAQERTIDNYTSGLNPNTTYTDLFCSMQVQNPHRKTTMTVGGDDGMGENAPNDGAIGVTSYSSRTGMRNEAPMNFPRWYPTGTTTPDGSIVVQGGSFRGGPGGPGVLTPEIYTPDEGTGWRLLEGAKSEIAYGDGQGGQPDENRWWYPRAFVAPGNGNIFNITGTQMYELNPSGDGEITLRGRVPESVANQGANGNPVGATSTAVMYEPGKILQVGGGWWANGGGPAGARAGFTVDITGGTDSPVVTPTEPMEYQRHWATATVLPDGKVLVTGGSRDNNGNGGYVTNPEIWDPETGEWTTIEVPYEHARLYHSTALLLPDGRVMIGGGGAPGPRNYTDVEYYSPGYLHDADGEPADRPEITDAPKKIGYDGTFDIQASGEVSRVTLVRNGSVTHGFNNDQNFQELDFSQSGGTVTISAPQDGTYAPPGAYMLFVHDADGTPSVAKIVDVDPEVEMDQRTPQVVDQFEYPRLPVQWQGNNAPAVIDLAPGNGRMSPWEVTSDVQLVRAVHGSQGGLGGTGYHLALSESGSIERTLEGLDPGREYRISLRYARDSRVPGAEPGTAQLSVGSLDTAITAGTDLPSQGNQETTFGTFVGVFTASQRSETLTLSGESLMVDDLVIISADPGVADVPVHYEFEEGAGTTAANTGTDDSVGAATLTGSTGWSEDGVFGGALDMPGGPNTNAVDLPDNLLQGEADFTTSFWVRPDTKSNWTGLFHIGDGFGGDGSFFQIQMQTQAAGNTGLAATFKAKGSALQERVYATPTKDVVAGEWNHVVFTRQGATGTLYLNGVEIASRDDLTIDMTDVGPTANNWLGRNGFPDASYDGLMDEVRVYRSTLTADDVSWLYAEGSALRTTTTVSVEPASPSPFAEPVTVSASVEDEEGQPAEGSVELWREGVRVGEAVDLVDGSATFPELADLSPGDHELEVRYLAADGWRDSAATATHTVERPPPGEGVPVHYKFDEGAGTTAANSGSDPSIADATLGGTVGWSPDGKYGGAVSLPGGASGTGNQVELPDNIEAGMDDEFTASLWVRPDSLPNWVSHLQIGSSTDTFFLLQSSTQTAGATGFAATFKAPGNPTQERLVLGPGNDVPLNEWTHVVFTMRGSTGKIYFNGELQGTRTDFTIDIGDVGVNGETTANMLGGTSWPDGRFDGLIDDFRLYGYELSEEDVQELFEEEPNTAPVATGDAYSADEGDPLSVTAPGVLANDTDAEGDPLTANGATQPADGQVTLNGDGSFTYTPDPGFSGTDTFTYTADDGTDVSGPATVTITVEPDPTQVDTTISGSAPDITYGKRGAVSVSVTPDSATGRVQVLNGGEVLGSARLSAGEAVIGIPARSLPPGGHRLVLNYLGDGSHEASSTAIRVFVKKAVPRIRVHAPAAIRVGDRAQIWVELSAAGDVPVTGQVRAVVNGDQQVVATVKANGTASLRLHRAEKVGVLRVRVQYLGGPFTKSVSKTVLITVRR
ncbi:LamG-like jellyroll fold domain-containing protein [Nocardioides bizhenqiangii]|uniref:LamG-like jellyroll fold domain-containing protein n=1 Tax=Nocardioides bizhenqiangii TaxID=3095076 RepID=A0ABZ0ZZI7_9ACTN|nr:LamG-like jellyroll fold domain-containing protein [Nocardioides sp. HM61]WQQ28802.1 LamG-like jellyroll fold domain-containing protein [Nocardioides sp. HM61]